MSIIFGKIGILLILSFDFIIINNIVNTEEVFNNEPIIGILSQETDYYNNLMKGEKSYIAASYVKFIEGAGARVVPIEIGKNELYYRELLSNINGVLWPGGAASFSYTNGYADAGNKIYQIAKEMNENGDYFPILGICLGFELLTYVAANKISHRKRCSSQSQPLHLEFDNSSLREAKLFANASPKIINILEMENVTINFHKFCITRKALKTVDLDQTFRVISENVDKNGIRFISTLEHLTLPFYGLQFHPEKNIYEWIKGKNIPHTSNAIEVGQYFANFFVNEARKSKHTFLNNEEIEKLIYNYRPYYTGKNNLIFEQIYLFSGKIKVAFPRNLFIKRDAITAV